MIFVTDITILPEKGQILAKNRPLTGSIRFDSLNSFSEYSIHIHIHLKKNRHYSIRFDSFYSLSESRALETFVEK